MSEHTDTRETPAATRAERILLALVLAVLLAMNFLAVREQLGRRLDHDEAEYLHAAWLMEQGRQIYRGFFEDHPPFLFQILGSLMPDGPSPDVFAWTVRARVFSALCGTWAMIAAGLIVWRITASGPAAALTLAALLGARWTWLRALADIRADAPTLALFMTGFLLVIWEEEPSWRMAWLSGWGISLAFAAALWNPKWPLVGLCLGVFFLARTGRLIRARRVYAIGAFLPTIVIVAAMYAALAATTTLDDYVFFNYLLKSQNMAAYRDQGWVAASFRGLSPFHHAPPRFAGIVPAALTLLMLLLIVREWRGLRRRGQVVLVLTMIVAAAVEVRVLHTWPNLWPQVFLALSFVLAIGYGVLSVSLTRFLGRSRRMRRLASAVILIVTLALAVPHLGSMMREVFVDPYSPSWEFRKELTNAIRPGETVWVGATRHPIVAFDESYFWYGLGDLMPMTLETIARNPGVRRYLPSVTTETLPVCQLARRRASRIRFIEISAYAEYTPGACACAQIVLSRPDIVPTNVAGVYERVPPGLRPIGPGTPPDWDSFVRRKVAECATR